MSGTDPRPTAAEQEPPVKMFSAWGNESDDPRDHIHEVIQTLSGVRVIFEADEPVDFTRDEQKGVWNILAGCIRVLESVSETVGVLISDPFRAGIGEGLKMGDGSYYRGFEEGQRAGIAATLALATMDGGAAVKEELRRLVPHLMEKLKKDAPPDPFAASPTARREAR